MNKIEDIDIDALLLAKFMRVNNLLIADKVRLYHKLEKEYSFCMTNKLHYNLIRGTYGGVEKICCLVFPFSLS